MAMELDKVKTMVLLAGEGGITTEAGGVEFTCRISILKDLTTER